jgi:hypothetical protein
MVHNGARVVGDKHFVEYLESKRPAIKIENGRITLAPTFCVEAIDTMETFLIQAIDSLA